MSRILPFNTVFNFRDFGDYPSQIGGRVAGGKLFRSANLNRLGGEDISTFNALDISAIIDMRYAPEREKQPNNLPQGCGALTLAHGEGLEQPTVKIAPHEAFMEHDLQTGADARGYMMGSYGRRPLDASFIKLTQNTLNHMINTGDNILIHCAAGKDRTGTLVAIIQHILGVSRDDIFHDYMLTMTAVDVERIIQSVLSSVSDRYGRRFSADMLRPMFGVSEDYLQAALDTIQDLDDYVETVIGLSADERRALCTHYLKEAPR